MTSSHRVEMLDNAIKLDMGRLELVHDEMKRVELTDAQYFYYLESNYTRLFERIKTLKAERAEAYKAELYPS